MTGKFFKSTVLCLLLTFGATGLFAQDNPYLNDDRILMTVGETPVTVSEFMFIYLKNNRDDVLDKKTVEEYVQMYANFKAKVNEAEAQKLDTAEAFCAELSGYRKDLAKPFFVDEKVVGKLVDQAYQRMQEDIRASHILIFCNENAAPKDTLAAYRKIDNIRKRILKGEDFATVAVETSDDPSAKDLPTMKGNKGDLGYFSVLNMVYPFETAAYSTPINTVSPIFRTSFGYHIVKTTDRQPAMGNVQVAHIFFQSKPEYTQEQNDSLLQLANTVYEKLNTDGQWETLVRQYSNDRATVTYNGVLPWFTCSRMDPNFIATVSRLKNKGDIAPPVKTDYGYHIVRLENTKPIPPFDEIKGDLRSKVLRDSRSELSVESVIEKIKKEYNHTIYTENLKKFQTLCCPSLLSGEWGSESVSKLNLPLFKLGDTILTTNDFIDYIESQPPTKQNEASVGVPETVETLITKYFTTWNDATCHIYEDSRLEQKHPSFRITLNEYYNGILLYEVIEREVWGRATTDTIGLAAFFEQNRDKYTWDERCDFTALHAEGFTSKKEAEKAKATILNMLKKGKSDKEIRAAFNKSKSPITIKIVHGKVEKGVNENIDEMWCNPMPGTQTKITEENSIEILRANKIICASLKELNEIRGLAIIDYQEYLEKTWQENLREKYPIKIDQEVLNSIK
ncbi:MAG: peptidyl-prolyl cis-trans isomerase [Bacteroidales bacterium]|nr:peptidyl-prolyl cis-trans isomerase [Bacteroidales bacterium]